MALKICHVEGDDNANDSSSIEVWLQSIVRMLQSLPENDEYRDKIQQWCTMREDTIKTLEELITALKTWHEKMVKVQFGGEVTSLAADIVSIVSGILRMCGVISGQTAKNLGAVGKAGGIAGGAVSTIAAGAKNVLEQQKATQAASAIKTDMEKSPELLEFLEPSGALTETVDRVLDFNIFCRVVDGFGSLYSETRSAVLDSDNVPTTLPDDVIKMVNHIPITNEEKERVIDVLTIIYRCYTCKKYLNFLIEYRKQHPFVLHSACLVSRLCVSLRKFQVPVALAPMAARGADAAYETRNGAGEVILPGIFAVIGVVNLLATKEELKGDDLELVKRIREYTMIMKKELNLFKSFEENYMNPTSNNNS